MKESLTKEEINEFRSKLTAWIPLNEGLKGVVKPEYLDGVNNTIKFVDLWLGKMLGEVK